MGERVKVEQAAVVKGQVAMCAHPLLAATLLALLLVQRLDGPFDSVTVILLVPDNTYKQLMQQE